MTHEDEGAKDLLDATLRDEIELVSDLVVAASASDRHLTPEEIDALLGLHREGRQAGLGESNGAGGPNGVADDGGEGVVAAHDGSAPA